ncbi:hypothetical protein Acid7E03_42440 [Acidisoma sp. 7E03]
MTPSAVILAADPFGEASVMQVLAEAGRFGIPDWVVLITKAWPEPQQGNLPGAPPRLWSVERTAIDILESLHGGQDGLPETFLLNDAKFMQVSSLLGLALASLPPLSRSMREGQAAGCARLERALIDELPASGYVREVLGALSVHE